MNRRFPIYKLQKKLGLSLRRKRLASLMEMIDSVFEQKGSVEIIDLGGTVDYWSIPGEQYLRERNVRITIINVQEIQMPDDLSLFRILRGDACDLREFEDNTFDIAHSNSVIEHVGDWDRMEKFAGEVSRIAEQYYTQTPNFWFPIEPHCMTPFFHWLPKKTRLWMVSNFQLGHWPKADSPEEAERILKRARLLKKRELCLLFNDAHILTERFFGLSKSFIAIRK